jgi:ERCC4-related helicase/dsRNA-specific ribonuclease
MGPREDDRPADAPQVSRKYQQEMIDHAVTENIICSLDTGSGKTHIAMQLIHHLYDAHRKTGRSQRSFVVMFLADRVPLVIQQAKYIQRSSKLRVAVYHGEMDLSGLERENWAMECKRREVIVMTAQVFYNLLAKGYMSLRQFNMIIFDECHHTRKKHPFNVIMEEHYFTTEASERPKIFGMTASPIHSKMSEASLNNIDDWHFKVKELESNLDCKLYTVREHKEELRQFVPRPKETTVEYDEAPPCITPINLACVSAGRGDVESVIQAGEATNILGMTFESVEIDNTSTTVHYSAFDNDTGEHIRHQRARARLLKKVSNLAGGINYVSATLGPWCTALAVQSAGLEFHNLPEYKRFKRSSRGRRWDASHPAKNNEDVLQEFEDALNRCVEQLSLVYDGTPMTVDNAVPKHMNLKLDVPPKLLKLVRLLGRYEDQHKFSGIIFVQRRFTAANLVEFIECCPKLRYLRGKVACLTGRAHNQDKGNTQGMGIKDQAVLLGRFRQGLIKVLVATAVAEEGIDVAACRLVVRFDEVTTPISYIQSRGRARHLDSRFVVLKARTAADARITAQVYDRMMQSVTTNTVARPSTGELGAGSDEEQEALVPEDVIQRETCITLLTQFAWSVLKCRPEYTYVPLLTEFRNGQVKRDGFVCNLKLHTSMPLAITSMGSVLQELKKDAKEDAAYRLCLELVRSRSMDSAFFGRSEEHRRSKKKKSTLSEGSKTFAATKSNIETRMTMELKTPACLAGAWADAEGTMTTFHSCILLIPRNEVQAEWQVAILTVRPLPLEQLRDLALVIYPNYASDPCQVKLMRGGLLHMDAAQIRCLQAFQLQLFNLLLRDDHDAFEQKECTKRYLIVPLIGNDYKDDAHNGFSDAYSDHVEHAVPVFNSNVYVSDDEAETLEPEAEECEEGELPDAGPLAGRIDWGVIREGFLGLDAPGVAEQVLAGVTSMRDVVLVTPHNGQMFVPRSILRESTPKSKFLTEEYADFVEYFRKQWGIQIKDLEQPLIEASPLIPQARNTLRKIDRRMSRGLIVLVPELCVVHRLRADLLGLFCNVPAILFGLESNLRLAEITRSIGLKVDPKLMGAALTSGGAQEHVNYERLEFLGDSYIKFRITTFLFQEYPSFNEDEMTLRRARYVGNNNLYRRARDIGLWAPASQLGPNQDEIVYSYIRTRPFRIRQYQAAGFPPFRDEAENLDTAQISSKVVADVVESLVAVYYLCGGAQAADAFMSLLRMPTEPYAGFIDVYEKKAGKNVQQDGNSEEEDDGAMVGGEDAANKAIENLLLRRDEDEERQEEKAAEMSRAAEADADDDSEDEDTLLQARFPSSVAPSMPPMYMEEAGSESESKRRRKEQEGGGVGSESENKRFKLETPLYHALLRPLGAVQADDTESDWMQDMDGDGGTEDVGSLPGSDVEMGIEEQDDGFSWELLTLERRPLTLGVHREPLLCRVCRRGPFEGVKGVSEHYTLAHGRERLWHTHKRKYERVLTLQESGEMDVSLEDPPDDSFLGTSIPATTTTITATITTTSTSTAAITPTAPQITANTTTTTTTTTTTPTTTTTTTTTTTNIATATNTLPAVPPSSAGTPLSTVPPAEAAPADPDMLQASLTGQNALPVYPLPMYPNNHFLKYVAIFSLSSFHASPFPPPPSFLCFSSSRVCAVIKQRFHRQVLPRHPEDPAGVGL